MPSKSTISRVCGACGVEFFAPAHRVRKGLAKFCSPKCNGQQTAALKSVPIMDRLWAKVDKNGPVPDYAPDLGPCWLWVAKKVDGKGYGQITDVKRTYQVHCLVYEALVGPIPEGCQLDHLCRVRRCCRPSHLEPVTQTENQRRGMGVSGVNFRKTECVNGHPFDEANTIIRKRGGRDCRICAQAAWRKYGATRSRRKTA